MNLQEVIETLSNEEMKVFPEEALTRARVLWPELLPHIDTLMDKFIQQQELTESEYIFLLFGIFLLADRAETSRFEALVKLCDASDEPSSPLDRLLGDSITESLPTILYILANGHYQPLIDLLLSGKSGEFVKSSALEALMAQQETNRYSQEQFEHLLPELFQVFSEFPFLLTKLSTLIIYFDCRSYQTQLLECYKAGQIEELELPLKHIEDWMAPDYFRLPRSQGYVKDYLSVMEMRSWAWFNSQDKSTQGESLRELSPEQREALLAFAEGHTPYVAPTKIGRNEPCPCGSGKKYKKCCMP